MFNLNMGYVASMTHRSQQCVFIKKKKQNHSRDITINSKSPFDNKNRIPEAILSETHGPCLRRVSCICLQIPHRIYFYICNHFSKYKMICRFSYAMLRKCHSYKTVYNSSVTVCMFILRQIACQMMYLHVTNYSVLTSLYIPFP